MFKINFNKADLYDVKTTLEAYEVAIITIDGTQITCRCDEMTMNTIMKEFKFAGIMVF